MAGDSNQAHEADDGWSRWLLERRSGRDADYQRVFAGAIERIADRVLDAAALRPGMTLLDAGTGDGLVAFRAISRTGGSLRVVMTDVSQPLLRHAEQAATERGVQTQCTFVAGSVDKLDGVADATVDVVTSRAVLAYVAEKKAALGEFHRALKPGGRLSVAEPIFQDDAFEAAALGRLIEAQPENSDLEFLRLVHRIKAAQFPATEKEIRLSPITNYSERDLIRMVREAGFVDIHMELHVDVRPSPITRWEVYLDTAPHPWSPTVEEILTQHFSQPERLLFESIMRPIIESRQSTSTDAIAYLSANKAHR